MVGELQSDVRADQQALGDLQLHRRANVRVGVVLHKLRVRERQRPIRSVDCVPGEKNRRPAHAAANDARDLPAPVFPERLPEVYQDRLTGFFLTKRISGGLPDIRGKFQSRVRPEVHGQPGSPGNRAALSGLS